MSTWRISNVASAPSSHTFFCRRALHARSNVYIVILDLSAFREPIFLRAPSCPETLLALWSGRVCTANRLKASVRLFVEETSTVDHLFRFPYYVREAHSLGPGVWRHRRQCSSKPQEVRRASQTSGPPPAAIQGIGARGVDFAYCEEHAGHGRWMDIRYFSIRC